jgi:hypothetical protein
MSIDFTPARRPNGGDRPVEYSMAIQRTDRKTRSGRPTSLYLKISPETIASWGVRDGEMVSAHFNEGIWEIRRCKDGEPGYSFRISGSFASKIRNAPAGWGSARLSGTKAMADKCGVTQMKFYDLVEVRDRSAFFIEADKGVSFLPARKRGA